MDRWTNLLSDMRYNGTDFFPRSKNSISSNPSARDYIKVFQEDIERIIYCTAFRRMQNKTQVHPLPDGDFCRNRLSHSLEVAQIGRLLATAIGRWLIEKELLPPNIEAGDMADIVYAACLIHDIGNPPFGHSGEEAIQSWFRKNHDRPLLKEVMESDDYKYDFLNFDGNAAGYRIISRTQNWRNRGGLRLSIATVGAFVKYPFSSSTNQKLIDTKNLSKKKFGYLFEDRRHFDAIFKALGLKQRADGTYPRHPLVYLVEAADDICYSATDVEDGVRSGIISLETGIELMKSACDSAHIPRLSEFNPKRDANRIMSYLRSGMVSTLVDDCYVSFIEDRNYGNIMDGKFSGSLIDAGNYPQAIKKIKSECETNLYVNRDKMEMEAGGFQIIDFLLDEFGATFEEIMLKGSPDAIHRKYKNLYHLLPPEVQEDIVKSKTNSYTLSCLLLDYIYRMSDKFAVDLFKKISGTGLVIAR